MKTLLALVALLFLAFPAHAQLRYHLELEANPAAPFPFLGKFGTVTLHVFPGGVRAETLLMNGFSRNGTKTITVENVVSRIATSQPIASIAPTLQTLGSIDEAASVVPARGPEIAGKVGPIDAHRYRLVYGPAAWIDIWTTTAIPPSPQFRTIVEELVRGIAPGTATALRTIPGTPLYVELNFRRYHKLPLLRLKSFTPNGDGEAEALRVGKLYFSVP